MVIPILFVVLIIFVAYPFLTETREKAVRENRENDWQSLQQEKEDAIATLKDIDMDYRMGKLSDEDYQSLKQQHEEAAVGILKKFEAMEKARPKQRS